MSQTTNRSESCLLRFNINLTEYGQHNVIFRHLNGTTGDEVEGSEYVAMVIEGVSRWGVGGFEAHGESSQTRFIRPTEHFTVLQQSTIQMQANVSLQTLWKTFHDLKFENKPKISGFLLYKHILAST